MNLHQHAINTGIPIREIKVSQPVNRQKVSNPVVITEQDNTRQAEMESLFGKGTVINTQEEVAAPAKASANSDNSPFQR